jgi:Na+/proline symporter
VVVTDVLQFVILTAAVLIVLPLSLDQVGGISTFLDGAPETFFNVFNGEYTPLFIFAFIGYNTIFIGGNWAYVQRYTSVATVRDAKKVGYLFGGLYLISPLIWMLPPMIYRVIDPSLVGLESEGAYLMMCMAVLPIGMLGLMLGGMIFATASSVNTSLNLAAAVLTNDIYKPLFPQSSNKRLMQVARTATLLFGLGTIGVAFMVPLAGGIVEVVLSIGAVTGGALYGPAIWGLFSKRQTGSSILWVTGVSLGVNLFFKFLAPLILNIKLDRSEEMFLGVGLPALLLGLYELWAYQKSSISAHFATYMKGKSTEKLESEEEANDSLQQNKYGIRVLGLAFIAIGTIFIALGAFADKGAVYTLAMGILISLLGGVLIRFVNKNNESEKKKQVKGIRI